VECIVEVLKVVNIIGAGLAGLSAAITLADKGISSNLISNYPSERAQSVMAEGGINGVLDTMGEGDRVENHFEDTMKAGGEIADEAMVRDLTEAAPGIIRYLRKIGVPFNLKENKIQQRNFGGQKKKRTAYAKSSTGKVIMTALIDEARKYETMGLIKRYSHHEFLRLRLENGGKVCKGVEIRDNYTGNSFHLEGIVILASGGPAGVFAGVTTGTTANTGDVTAKVFAQGVRLSNLEMIQYHPTTVEIADKVCLVSEAARGEGGRLFIYKDDKKYYFMEEKYPEFKNLMPRDVVSREMYFVSRDNGGAQVYLDMTELPKEVWKERLPDLREEIIHYLGIDPKNEPIPVRPGIHYFMGGIDVDIDHKTNVENLFAAGEACSAYHGANRLGGNSLLGAIYGGRKVAESAAKTVVGLDSLSNTTEGVTRAIEKPLYTTKVVTNQVEKNRIPLEIEAYNEEYEDARESFIIEVRDILLSSLGIVRNETLLNEGIAALDKLALRQLNEREKERLTLAKALILSALCRKESRGANFREDYPDRNDEFKGLTKAHLNEGNINIEIWRADGSSN
jgi:hypothetical protein